MTLCRTFTLLILAMTLIACATDKADITGTYTAEGDTEIVLTLNKDGKGTWSTDIDEIPFKWTIRKDGTLWLHTKAGGVIQGVVKKDTIHLTLPGVDELAFKKQP